MSAETTYLEDEVLTASPQRLRLMLIDGAIRFARQTLAHWQVDYADAASQTLMRTRAIVTELLASVRNDRASCEHLVDHLRRDRAISAEQRARDVADLQAAARSTTALYVFLFRELTEAQMNRDAAKLAGAIRILEIERETTRLLCERQAETPQLDARPPGGPREITARDAAVAKPAPILGGHHFGGAETYGGVADSAASISFDA